MNMHFITNVRSRRATTPYAYLVDHFPGMWPSPQPVKAVSRRQNRIMKLEAWRRLGDGRKCGGLETESVSNRKRKLGADEVKAIQVSM